MLRIRVGHEPTERSQVCCLAPVSRHMPVSGSKSEASAEKKLFEEGSEELGFGRMKKCQLVAKQDEPYSCSTTSSHTISSVRYGECQKNHAASIGGYAVDGCREFMASGEEGTNAALKCAACGCHRNFHRREVETEVVCESSSPSSNGK